MAEIPAPARRPIRFSSFELDPKSGELRKAGILVGLQDQSLKVLVELLERPGDLVTREQLRQRLWPNGTFVDFEHGLNAVINRLRETLGDSAESPRFIQTVPRRGYRFIAPVERRRVRGHRQRCTAPRSLESRKWMVVGAAGIVLALAAVALLSGLRSSPRGSMRTIPLTSLPGKERHPSFSPDGGGIAFSWDGEKGDNEDIYVKVIGTELPLRLTTKSRGRPVPGLVVGRTPHCVCPLLGGGKRTLRHSRARRSRAQNPLADHVAGRLVDGPSWSPDGQSLAIAEKGRDFTSSIFILSTRDAGKTKADISATGRCRRRCSRLFPGRSQHCVQSDEPGRWNSCCPDRRWRPEACDAGTAPLASASRVDPIWTRAGVLVRRRRP